MPVSLIGLPGVGKSTIGRKLARRLGFGFVDCDGLIEQRLQERIRSFFERDGEAAFRSLEEQVLAELVAAPRQVIATGGGAVLRAANRLLLRERTTCIYLHARPADLVARLQHDSKRPLMQGADPLARLEELLREREPLYRESAAIVVETRGRQSTSVLDEICAALSHGNAVRPPEPPPPET